MNTVATPFGNGMPRDLRGGGPAEAGAGKTYPVDPAAVERLKAHMEANKAAPARQAETAVPTTAALAKIDPARYPPEALAAARAQEQADGRRDIASVLTDEVLAIWSASGLSTKKVAMKAYNGLINITQSQASNYLRSYRERLEARTGTTEVTAPPLPLAKAPSEPPAETGTAVSEPLIEARPDDTPETAVSQPDPEPEPTAVEPFAVQKPENLPAFLDRDYVPQRPRPGDALAALVQLMNDEKLTVRGSVKLNLEIEFG